MPANPPGSRRRLSAWWQRRRALKRQRTFIYCPLCKFEMVAGGEWLGQNITDPSIEGYRCAKCGTTSAWNFDAPAPFLTGWPLTDPGRFTSIIPTTEGEQQ